jgi:hypothetical protein
MSIDFLMMLCALVFDWCYVDFFNWFMSLIMNKGSSFYEVCSCILYWTGLVFQSLNSPSCHSARRACPELQNPLPHFAKKNLLPGEMMPARANEGWGKNLFPGPFPPSATVPPLPEEKGYSLDDGFCDFAFGFAQNDRVGGIQRRLKVFGLENPTERKSFAMSIDVLMKLSVLVRIVAMSIGCWLIHFFDKEHKQFILWSL